MEKRQGERREEERGGPVGDNVLRPIRSRQRPLVRADRASRLRDREERRRFQRRKALLSSQIALSLLRAASPAVPAAAAGPGSRARSECRPGGRAA